MADDGIDGKSGEKSINDPRHWRGCSMDEIYRNLNPFELEHLPSVRPSAEHTVLHAYPIKVSDDEPPPPYKGHPKWDSSHVRLPCSPKSQYPVTAEDGSATIESRWEMIEKALLQPIKTTQELEAAILTYNSKYASQWTFRALHKMFEKDLDESEKKVFFEDLLPRIIRLALRLPELVQAPIPLLKQGNNHSLTLTQEQISCLLANAFLCTFPRRNTVKRKSEYGTFPDINFNRLYQQMHGKQVHEKIKCIFHYFRRVCPTESDSSNVPTGVVTFTRRSIPEKDFPKWDAIRAPLGATPLHITSEGTIEDASGLLQVDFANKFLGGGVLGSGCVQEEIRFVICPELLISKLFTECLRPNEALLMVGAERFCDYTGYANSFRFAGNHEDATPFDHSRRRMTHIVAIDALAFGQTVSYQYKEDLMLRELNKAYAGFRHTLVTPAPGVASGNWGCGAFGGEATLKALLQLIVCTVAQRPLVYYTFGNNQLRDAVHKMHTFFIEENVTVAELWAVLRKFYDKKLASDKLYDFIYSHIRKPNPPKPSGTGSESASSANPNTAAPASTSSSDMRHGANRPNCKNYSEDIFASSTESDDDSEKTKAGASAKADVAPAGDSQAPTSSDTRILISDDSDTDALLVAAVEETQIDKSNNNNNNNNNEGTGRVGAGPRAVVVGTSASAPQTPSKARTGPRQRTLLEMLDQCYTEGSPATKRHCTVSDNSNTLM